VREVLRPRSRRRVEGRRCWSRRGSCGRGHEAQEDCRLCGSSKAERSGLDTGKEEEFSSIERVVSVRSLSSPAGEERAQRLGSRLGRRRCPRVPATGSLAVPDGGRE